MAQFKDPFLRDLENLSESGEESEQILQNEIDKEGFESGSEESWQENEE